ncbi:hypothetical protein C8R45DRAFT_477918 [Mycena sanguinolenta]|nr:hypothetical protein C8R45DRAFT_477918 [Mycena sanguinolenta]
MAPDPIFPAELEHEIFETTALLYPATIPPLLRVARRVLVWIEPLLYRVIGADFNASLASAFERALRTKPPDFFRHSVKHVFLGADSSYTQSILEILRLCPDIISLTYVVPDEEPGLLELLKKFRGIRRWSGCLKDLFGDVSAVDLGLAVFRSVTHMDLFDHVDVDAPSSARLCEGVCALPALTHLCLNRRVDPEILRNLLQGCPRLRVLVNMWADSTRATEMVAAHREAGVDDIRYVVVVCYNYLFDWDTGARGGIDFWVAADDFVARKCRSEIEDSSYLLENW